MEGLYYLMEDFINNEVNQDLYDENEKNAARARRRLRRNLNKELTPYFNKEINMTNSDKKTISDSDSESSESPYKKTKYDYNEPIIIPQRHVDICLGISFVCVIFTFYGTIFYVIQLYYDHLNYTY